MPIQVLLCRPVSVSMRRSRLFLLPRSRRADASHGHRALPDEAHPHDRAYAPGAARTSSPASSGRK